MVRDASGPQAKEKVAKDLGITPQQVAEAFAWAGAKHAANKPTSRRTFRGPAKVKKKLVLRLKGCKDVTFIVWDFGGQEVTHLRTKHLYLIALSNHLHTGILRHAQLIHEGTGSLYRCFQHPSIDEPSNSRAGVLNYD